MQKKISCISKHKIEAKDEWANLQKKLQEGVIDSETKKIYDKAKNQNMSKYEVQRRNLTQMIEYEKEIKNQCKEQSQISSPKDEYNILEIAKNMLSSDKSLIEKVKEDLENTKQLIHKVDKYGKKDNGNPKKLLDELLILQENSSVKKNKSGNQQKQQQRLIENKENFRNEEDMIESSKKLKNEFQETLNMLQQEGQERISLEKMFERMEKSMVNNEKVQPKEHDETQNLQEKALEVYQEMSKEEYLDRGKQEGSRRQFELELSPSRVISPVKQQQGYGVVNRKLDLEPLSPSNFFKTNQESIQQMPIPLQSEISLQNYENVTGQEDNLDGLRKLLEQTRTELEQMNLNNLSMNSFMGSEYEMELKQKSISLQNPIKSFQILGNYQQSTIYPEAKDADIEPRQLNVTRQEFQKTVSQFSRKYKNSANSFNIYDNLKE